MSVPSWDFVYAAALLALIVAAGLYTLSVPEGGRRWWALATLLSALVLASLVLAEGWSRVLLLDAAAFVAVALVWIKGTPQAVSAARTYLGLLILSVICIGAGMALGGVLGESAATPPAPPLDRLALGLLVAGFALKLALAPLYFWLPGVAEWAAPMTTVLIVSVVDIAAFGELAHMRVAAPWLFGQGSGLWLAVALLSLFGGSLLALAQTDVKRMLAFSSIDDMGYLLIGVLAGPGVGLTGALAGALSHALCKLLLFGSVGVVEKGTGRSINLGSAADRGLMARYPVSGIAFIVGVLGMIGVPPALGFVGRWRLYLAGMQYAGPWLALLMVAATGLALLYYVRATHRVWFGPASTEASALAQESEPKLAAGVLAVLAIAAIVIGLFPAAITGLLS